ncbi:DUF4142 domain-containing protein [Nannocystis punicea]|uniref:DUF4142 domain-containing protein n=1 Tax=Nannocystis punicea TaxID=2995304 RepID=A0ABY7H863_9BACT|nr:DUF4142 domain-containing protein [Nannocystis poenicansa]WAS95451.1 DUF4142 domain-containing protein [Nannocystis poenicansa]
MSICRSVVLGMMVAAGGASGAAEPAPSLPLVAVPRPPASDAELLGVLATIHAVNRAAAEPGRKRGKDPRVQALAEEIVHHAWVGQHRTAALVRKMEVKNVGGDTTDGLRFAAKRAFPEMESLARGREFDEAWLAGQIETLTLVIDTINNKSRPYAQAQALRDELVRVVEQAAADLVAAETVRAELGKPTS